MSSRVFVILAVYRTLHVNFLGGHACLSDMLLLRKPGPLLLLLLAGLAAAQPSKDTTPPPFKNDDSGEKKLKPPKIPKEKLPKPPTRPPGAPSSQDQRTRGEMPDFVTPLMKHVDTNGDDLISREEVRRKREEQRRKESG